MICKHYRVLQTFSPRNSRCNSSDIFTFDLRFGRPSAGWLAGRQSARTGAPGCNGIAKNESGLRELE
ncbi:MAG: hypothetical protein NVS9B14_24130 [Candidatus Acidiferrum sp.]